MTMRLEPGQSVAQKLAAERLELDCMNIANLVDRKPGIGSKGEIAGELGMTPERVDRCLKRINHNESAFARIDYGRKTAKEGPWAGEERYGWWPMKRASYQPVLDQADGHSSSVEMGVRRSRLMRLAYAHGLGTKAAEAAIASIEARLAVDYTTLSTSDFETFAEMVAEEVEA